MVHIIMVSVSQSSVYNISFITSCGTVCTLHSLCILINYLAINATMRIRLYNRLTPWQFIKQISGKAVTWNKQLIPYHSRGVFTVWLGSQTAPGILKLREKKQLNEVLQYL